MSEPRVIKRYANRKLYDTRRSRYVTLDQIADMIRDGGDVKIIDNTSKDDLTSVTLAQIILEQERRQKEYLPLGAMMSIIRSGGESLQEIASHAGARVRSVFQRDALGVEGAEGEAPETPDEAAQKSNPTQLFRDFLERSQQTFDEWQKRVDERIRVVVETIAPWTALVREVTELEQRLADLEKKLTSGRDGPDGNDGSAG